MGHEVFVCLRLSLFAIPCFCATGALTDQVAPIKSALIIAIGGVQAKVAFAGLVPPYAQLYQLNVEVPDSLPDGDHAVIAQIGGQTSNTGPKITVLR